MKEYKNIANFMSEATDFPLNSKELIYEIANLSSDLNRWKKGKFVAKYVDGDYIFAKMDWVWTAAGREGVKVTQFTMSEHNVKLVKAIAEMRLDFMDAN